MHIRIIQSLRACQLAVSVPVSVSEHMHAQALLGFPRGVSLRLLKMRVLPLIAGSMVAGKCTSAIFSLSELARACQRAIAVLAWAR